MKNQPAPHLDADSSDRILSDAPCIDSTASIGQTEIGRFCEIGARCRIAETRMGDYSYVSNDTEVIYTRMGKFCSIASHVRINPGNHPLERAALHHFTYRASKYGFGDDEAAFFDWRRSHRVTMGNDVWVGHGAIILPGVSIGDGAVIGAGAIVSRDVADFAIVIGVPARPHRFRFEADIRASLKRIAWWDWPSAQLHAALQDFRALPIAAFCAKYETNESGA